MIIECALAAWFAALMLVHGKPFRWLREAVGVGMLDLDTGEPVGRVARTLSCFWCTSFVAAVCVRALWEVSHVGVQMLAIAGAASLAYIASRTYLAVER